MFSQVSVCPQGVSAPFHAGIYSPGPEADTPLGRHPSPWADNPPPEQTPPGKTSPWADTPWADTPPGRHPPGRHPPLHSACWDTVSKRAIRIPLECIRVLQKFSRHNKCIIEPIINRKLRGIYFRVFRKFGHATGLFSISRQASYCRNCKITILRGILFLWLTVLTLTFWQR